MKLLRKTNAPRYYYKHYNGKRPVLAMRRQAARLSDEDAVTIQRQLQQLGFAFTVVETENEPR